MKNKLISLILIVALITAMPIFVNAEDSFSVIPSDVAAVYVNGKKITGESAVTASDKVRLVTEDKNAVIAYAEGNFYELNKSFNLTGSVDFTDLQLFGSGLNLVDGAQVRVGNVTLSEDGRMDSVADSGLRFLATCDYADTVIAFSEVEFGIKVSAEGSDTPIYIKAEKFQNNDKSLFSAAVTNLSESNYNRKYTAECYAFVPLFDNRVIEINSGSVTRSIYQVSVGILKSSTFEVGELNYAIDEAVKNVLSAYVKQTGIRLTYSSDGTMSARTEGKGAYTGDVSFAVTSVTNANSTSVVIKPLGEEEGFKNKVDIPAWWEDYIRINNNNSVAINYISDVKMENGELSFVFTIPEDANDYTFNQEDNVTIITEVTDTYIKGIKAGEAVAYSIGDNICLAGRANGMEDVVPGSVALIAEKDGVCKAVELLASLGMPINPENFEDDFGVYDASDGSSKYKNVVSEMYSKSGTKIVCTNKLDGKKTAYVFESTNSMCYRVGIAMDGDKPVITATGSKISTYPTIFENTSDYHNYLYLRYDSESEKVVECVFYCVPKDIDFSGDGEYSDIFGLDDYRVIIE